MPGLSLALAGLVGATLGAAPSLDVGLLTEARYRTTQATGTPAERLAEGEVAPWLKAGLAWPGFDLAVDYRPQLTLTDTGGGTRALLHQGSLSGRWQADATWLVSALAAAKAGEINRYQLFSSGLASGDPTLLFPAVASVGYRSVEGTLGVGVTLGLRHRLQISVGAADEGGATLEDQRWLPRQQKLRGLLGLEWDAGPHDVLSTVLEGTVAQFSTGPSVGTAGLTETWKHAASESVRFWMGAGPALTAQRFHQKTTTRLLPSAEVGLGFDGAAAKWPLKGTAALVLAPYVDRIAATAPERAGVTATLVATPTPHWRMEANGSATVVVEGPQKKDQAWGGSVQVGRSLGEFIELAVGVRGVMQKQPRFFTTTLDWSAFLALEVHTRRADKIVPDPAAVQDPLRPKAQVVPEEP
jgi:hypothetical protein